jgi:hypothetical protein
MLTNFCWAAALPVKAATATAAAIAVDRMQFIMFSLF